MEMRSMSDKSRRSAGIDAVRAFCCYAIVFHHMVFPGVDFGAGRVEEAFVDVIRYGFWTLPTLFLLSGYLMMRGYSGSVFMKLRRRIKRLVVPFIAYNLVELLIRSSNGSINWDEATLAILGLRVETPCSQFWYIRALIVLFALSPVFYYMTISRKRRIIGLILLSAWAIASTLLGLDKCLHKVLPAYSLILCFVGAVLATCQIDLCKFASSHRRWLVPLGIVGMLLFGLGMRNGILLALPGFLWIAFSDILERLFASKPGSFLIETSFFAYGAHLLFRDAISWGYASNIGPYLMQRCGSLSVATIVGFVVCVACMMITYIILHKASEKIMFFRLPFQVINGTL